MIYAIRYTIHEPSPSEGLDGRRTKTGVTLVEILVVVAIIAILATMVIGIAARIDNQAKERLAKSTIAIINAALGQFQDYGYRYKHSDYTGFEFPLDCNDFDQNKLTNELEKALDKSILIIPIGSHDPNYSGSEALYFFLSRVPESRKTLEKIDWSLLTSEGSDKQDMIINIDGRGYPLYRFIDPWGTILRYDYYDEDDPDKDEARTFPLITSAGPDGKFNTFDDITGR